MASDPAFLAMRQSLVDRGLIDREFRLTDAGNEHAIAIIAQLEQRSPKSPKVAEMRSIGHPAYEYQPLSDETRAKMSEAQRTRLGIPLGHRRVYGVNVPEAFVGTIRPLATEIAGKQGFEAAKAFVLDAEKRGWKHDASKVPVKQKNIWTAERRRKVSEAAKANHAKRRAERTAQAQETRTEETVNAQTKVASIARDDKIREIHGVFCIDAEKRSKNIIVSEHDSFIGLEGTYTSLYLTAAQARYLADRLLALASRLDYRRAAA